MSMLILAGCREHDVRKTPVVLNIDPGIKKISAGSSIQVSVQIIDDRLLKAKKVEVTLDDAVKKLMEDAFITSAKTELPITWTGRRATFEVPTTYDFRPGVWHIKQMRFFIPETKTWLSAEEGTDYDGTPILMTNSTRFVTDKPKLEIVQMQEIGGQQ